MMSNLVVHARIELEKTRRRLTDIFESLRLFEEWVILEDQRQSRSRLSSSFSDTARLRRSQMSRKSGSIILLGYGATRTARASGRTLATPGHFLPMPVSTTT